MFSNASAKSHSSMMALPQHLHNPTASYLLVTSSPAASVCSGSCHLIGMVNMHMHYNNFPYATARPMAPILNISPLPLPRTTLKTPLPGCKRGAGRFASLTQSHSSGPSWACLSRQHTGGRGGTERIADDLDGNGCIPTESHLNHPQGVSKRPWPKSSLLHMHMLVLPPDQC